MICVVPDKQPPPAVLHTSSVYRWFATSLCTRTRISLMVLQHPYAIGPLLYMTSSPLGPDDMDASAQFVNWPRISATGPRFTRYSPPPLGPIRTKLVKPHFPAHGALRRAHSSHGAVLGSVNEAPPLVTCTDCCAPRAATNPRAVLLRA